MRLSEGVPQDANRGAVSATETVALMAPAAGGAWQPSDIGLYRAVAANSAREVTSSVATLAIADEPVANTVVFINEVHYRSSGSEDWVEFINTGSETIDIGDWWLCARFKYGKINTLPLIVGSGYVLDPGEILVVRAHTDLDNNASDLGLYTSDDFTSATAMVDFVQWGAGRRTF